MTLNVKHTPGPWLCEGNTVYALMRDGWHKGIEQFRNRFFAQVHVDVSCSDGEREANARLIAAAPELLEALCDLVDVMTGRMNGETVALHNALVTITKATGENQ